MNIELSDEAREYGEYARRAFESAGGDELDPGRRTSSRSGASELVASVFAELGAWDLDPRGSADDLEAAAALCRGVGYWVVAVPGRGAPRPPRSTSTPTAWSSSPTSAPAAPLAGVAGPVGRR